jgi:hypothetical protein
MTMMMMVVVVVVVVVVVIICGYLAPEVILRNFTVGQAVRTLLFTVIS